MDSSSNPVDGNNGDIYVLGVGIALFLQICLSGSLIYFVL
jgi:hypothetical protein